MRWDGIAIPDFLKGLGRAMSAEVLTLIGILLIGGFFWQGGLAPAWAIAGLLYVIGMGSLARHWRLGGMADEQRRIRSTSAGSGSLNDQPIWHQLIDAMPDAAIVLDRQQRVIGANESAEEIFGNLSGRAITRVARDPELLAAIDRAVASQEAEVFEMSVQSPVARRLAGIVTRIHSTNSIEPAYVISLRDRTEFEQLAQMRADFVANASHELRTPLASLRGFVETLQGPAKDDPAARERFLGIMNQQAMRMTRLIDDLLTLSRVEMHVHVRPRTTVDLVSVLNGVVQSLSALAQDAGVRIVMENAPAQLVISGDPDELMQVFQNLVQNAIKYGRVGGSVRIQLMTEMDRVRISVIDDGPGIAPEHVPRLTERFYRVDVKDSRERGGTGLGLAIVKHIVTRHGGQLEISSELGKGSTFAVLLPRT